MNRSPVLALLSSLALISPLPGNEVVWTAQGEVTATGGAGFAPLVSTGDSVTLELRYNNEALPEPMAISDLPGILVYQEYRVDLNLDHRVTVRGSTWQGTLVSGTIGQPYTVVLQDYRIGPGTADFFRVNLMENDGAQFPLFPGATPGPGTEMTLLFNSAVSTTAAGPDYLGSTMLKCVSQSISRIADATGRILTNGAGGFEYTIDPATIRTELLGVSVLKVTDISYNPEFDEVTMTWESVPGRDYTIQYLDEFLCWRDYIFTFAINETELSETFFPVGSGVPATQLYRVLEVLP